MSDLKDKRMQVKRIDEKAELFQNLFWETHARDRYDISVNPNGNLAVSCKIHGLIWDKWTPSIPGSNQCRQCGDESKRKDFRRDIENKHPNLDILTQGPIYRMTTIEVRCRIHDFTYSKKAGKIREAKHTCNKCLNESKGARLAGLFKDTTESFVEKSKKLFGDEAFDYSDTVYGENQKDLIALICKVPGHGPFSKTPNIHLLGAGCPKCGIRVSKPHQRILDFIEHQLKTDVEYNVRGIIDGKNSELDVLVKGGTFAVEINGVYWHTEKFNHNKNRHLDKLSRCTDKGIELLQFTDKEILSNWTAVRSIIRSRLKKNDMSIGARTCEIKEVPASEANEFLDQNHLQGRLYGKFSTIGLYKEDELLMLASFGESRFDKKSKWELLRLCTKYNFTVSGGASRLLSCFGRKNPGDVLVTYADRRYSAGASYRKLGFEFSHNSEIGYVYVSKQGHVVSRYKAQKHKLKDLLENFDPDLSESSNMSANGYHRMWDCGQAVFYKRL
jgi:hypothetical protein